MLLKPRGPIRATVRVPGSKSITNRALVCAALAKGASTLTGASDSDDTALLVHALRTLGYRVEPQGGVIRVEGAAGAVPERTGRFHLGNAGTSLRFLTALVSLGEGPYDIDGGERMRKRPIGELVDALRSLGARVDYLGEPACPPLRVRGRIRGGVASLPGRTSSQFISALLMVAPAAGPIRVGIGEEVVSEPYIRMTLGVMVEFGVTPRPVPGGYEVPAGAYAGRTYAVEPDAASANYFYAIAAATGGSVTVEGLGASTTQGEALFLGALERMGARVTRLPDRTTVTGASLRGIDIDAADFTDSAQTLAVLALFATGPTTIRGVANLRVKETDRLQALATELAKLGAKTTILPDGIRIEPGEPRGGEIETYDDHRMAMSFAVAGARIPGVTIRNPECVSKSFPAFWDRVREIGLV